METLTTITTSPTCVMSTPTRPKRPLSAYNLFYRFKRGKIVELQPHHGNGSDEHKEIVRQIVMAAPGLEEHTTTTTGNDVSTLSSDDAMKELRRDAIRSALVNNLLPTDNSKRYHRKTHGAISFLEMNKVMCSAWKAVDDFGSSVFKELAEEAKQEQLKRVAEYDKMYPNSKKMKKKQKMKYRGKARRVTMDNDDNSAGVVSTRDEVKHVTDNDLNLSTKKKKKKKKKMVHDTNGPKARRVSVMSTVDTLKFEDGLDIPGDIMFDDSSPLVNGFVPPSSSPMVPPPKVNDVPGGYTFGDSDTSSISSHEDIWDALPFMPFSSEEEEMLQNEPISQLPSEDFMRLIASLDDSMP